MYKLIIAEDEYFERESIKLLLAEYFNNEIEIIYEATNGMAAIEKIFHNKPDIILLDIHMPKLDGISAAETIKEKWPDIEILILTANSKFEYAKKAIHIGVNDFLVKPYSNESFEEAIRNVLNKIKKRENEKQKYKQIEENVNSIKDVLEKEFIDIIIGDIDFEKDVLKNYIHLLKIKNEKFCVLVIKSVRDVDTNSISDDIKNKLANVSKTIIGSEYFRKNILICFVENEFLFNLKLKELETIMKNSSDGMYYEKSSYHTNLDNIKECYLEANQKLMETIKNNRINNFSYPFKSEEMLYKKIFDCDKEESIKLLNKIFNYFINQKVSEANFEMKKFIKQIALLIDRLLNQNLNDSSIHFKTEDIINQIDKENDYKKSYLLMKKYIEDSIALIDSERNNKGNKVIEVAKQYLELNCEKNISLNEVADYIGVSSYHLSKSFKKEFGINFKEFLTKIKIEESKKLLLKGNFNITEIAYHMGFSDPGYFSTSFKKNTGMSPKEFLNNTKK